MDEILYDQVKAAQYMVRLLRAKYLYVERGDNFFDYLGAIGVNLRRLLRDITEKVKAGRDSSEKQKALKLLYHIRGCNLSSLCRNLYDFVNEYPYIKSLLRECSLKICEEISKYKTSDEKNFELARKRIEKIFGFSRDALDFLEFAFIVDNLQQVPAG